ncbi:hypothetical protein EZV62_024206 [Acer yangbiense]|uniref:Uncharacterized protein n=1 Tax=Acer yangbiense TaxID=1000413 RepID=A0A5C7H5G6_9ROSI|nr:hypothetical protein EZV62_024206 [Acer yangbiense]
MSLTSTQPAWILEVENSYHQNPLATTLIPNLLINPTDNQEFSLQGGILRRNGLIYVGISSTLRERLVEEAHSSTTGGHSGIKGTLKRLQLYFYWVTMRKDVIAKNSSEVRDFTNDKSRLQSVLKEALLQAQAQMKFYASRRRSKRVFEVGKWVYLRLQPYRQSTMALLRNLKLAPRNGVKNRDIRPPYRSLLRTAHELCDYNIREYTKRHTTDGFRQNQKLSDPDSIWSAYAEGKNQLALAKRQSVVYSLYAPKVKSVMELDDAAITTN